MLRATALLLLLSTAVIACRQPPAPMPSPMSSIDELADRYVRLVLAVGVHDQTYVDMFYGSPEWQRDASSTRAALPELRNDSRALLEALRIERASQAENDRRGFLKLQTTALAYRIEQLTGVRSAFDDEARALFGFTMAPLSEADLAPSLIALDRRLPGTGPVAARLEAFSRSVAVPPDRVPAVVEASLAACRSRTAAHLTLPEGEQVEIAYVSGRPWSAYARYAGGFRTRIEINVDLPRRPDQILDLMCHEAYPGHHAQYSLVESRLVRGRNWREHLILPLLSPASALSEGAATAGVDLVFPPAERRAFERDHLFPLAGLSVDGVDASEDVRALTNQLAAAGAEAARRYLDGRLTRAEAGAWLERHAAMPRPVELLGFVDRFRSYVVGYTEAATRVERYVEGDWTRFEALTTEATGPARLVRAASTEYRSSTAPLQTGTTHEGLSRRP